MLMNSASALLRASGPLAHGNAPKGRVPRPLALTLSGAMLGSVLAIALVFTRTGLALAWSDFLPFIGLAFAMLGLGAICHMRHEDKRLAHAAGVVGTASLALLTCGILSNAGLRLGMPLSDPLLASIDAAIGVNVGTLVRWFAQWPAAIDILAQFYNASHLLLAALICWSLFRGNFAKSWELLTTAALSMQVVAMVSILMPAWGAMRHFALLDLQGNGLPPGAGVYHGEAFRHFYEGTDPLFTLADMNGVVTFPSFHTVIALMIAQALAPGPLRFAGQGICAITIVSTIPIGGHYLVDLVGGAIIWLCCASLAKRLVPSP